MRTYWVHIINLDTGEIKVFEVEARNKSDAYTQATAMARKQGWKNYGSRGIVKL